MKRSFLCAVLFMDSSKWIRRRFFFTKKNIFHFFLFGCKKENEEEKRAIYMLWHCEGRLSSATEIIYTPTPSRSVFDGLLRSRPYLVSVTGFLACFFFSLFFVHRSALPGRSSEQVAQCRQRFFLSLSLSLFRWSSAVALLAFKRCPALIFEWFVPAVKGDLYRSLFLFGLKWLYIKV